MTSKYQLSYVLAPGWLKLASEEADIAVIACSNMKTSVTLLAHGSVLCSTDTSFSFRSVCFISCVDSLYMQTGSSHERFCFIQHFTVWRGCCYLFLFPFASKWKTVENICMYNGLHSSPPCTPLACWCMQSHNQCMPTKEQWMAAWSCLSYVCCCMYLFSTHIYSSLIIL